MNLLAQDKQLQKCFKMYLENYIFYVHYHHRIIDDRIEKITKGRQISTICVNQGSTSPAPPPFDSTPTPSSCCTGPAAPTDHTFTPRPAGVGNGGGRRVRQGKKKNPNLILMQSLHLKYTCGKCANADCAEFVFPLYSFLFCHL